MAIISDYHMHTYLCGHADGRPQEYAQQACDRGLKEIGFADHAPLVTHREPSITMDFDQLPEYKRMVEEVQSEFKNRLTIKLAIEADFIPGYEEKTREILDMFPYDYVIGSVHYLNGWQFDNPVFMSEWDTLDVNEVYIRYHEHLRMSAESRLFDIMAHVDLVKKFGHRTSSDLSDEIKKTAEVFKQTGVAIEINTSGLRKPAKEIYPSLEDLKVYSDIGVAITFGSDAHGPEDVGRDFDKALQLARAAGYKEYVLFKHRKIEKTMGL